MLQFDKAINQALATRVKSRLTFRVRHIYPINYHYYYFFLKFE